MDAFLPTNRNSHTMEEDGLEMENTKMTGAPPPKRPKVRLEANISKKQAEVGSCSLSKKEFRDEIKAALRLEKYEVHRMRIDVYDVLHDQVSLWSHGLYSVFTNEDGRRLLSGPFWGQGDRDHP